MNFAPTIPMPPMSNMYQPRSPQQMQNEISQALSNYQNMFNQFQNMSQPTSNNKAVGESGDFVKVKGFDEVEEAPTRLDGTATLFFNFENRVFWSKKYVNGGHVIQSFRFEPINNSQPEKNAPDYTELLKDEDIKDPYEERFLKLEQTLENIMKNIQPQTKEKTNKRVKEDVIDEI